MYMAPIVRETRAPSTPLARRVVGVPVLAVSAAVMLPWLAITAAVSAAMLGGRALGQAPRFLLQAIDYAGAVTLGR